MNIRDNLATKKRALRNTRNIQYLWFLFFNIFWGSLLLSGLLHSCASKPSAPKAEFEPITKEQSAPDGSDELQALKDLEEKAKGAIARAESAGAAELSPELLDEAYMNLRNGQQKDPAKDGGAQRDQYLAAIDKADSAYDDALQKSRGRWLTTIGKYEADLDKLNAALYMPEYNANSRELLRQLRAKIAEGDNDESLALFQSTIPNVDAVVTALAANLDWLDQLRQEVTGLMGEADRQDLQGESAVVEQRGRDAYDSALGHRDRGDMQSMEQDLYDARYYLRKALRNSDALDPSRIDALLRSVQARLENASNRIVIDERGNELQVEQWTGENFLSKHPLRDLDSSEEPTTERRRDESKLQQPLVSEDFYLRPRPAVEEDGGKLSLLPAPKLQPARLLQAPAFSARQFAAKWQLHLVAQRVGQVPAEEPGLNEGNPLAQDNEDFTALPRVNADSTSIDSIMPEIKYAVDDGAQTEAKDLLSDAQLLFKQAIRSWENAVTARNKGNLPKAQHYLEEAARLLDQYNVQYAILGHYTVRRLKPEDCLWRIAGYADIYNDPYQWTRIYQRNRDIIANPHLIYPGQRLVIPPAKEQ